jgi:D-alanyl-D-alanine carboxypeptidase
VLNDPLKQWPPQELINIALSHPFYFAPGSGWHYSNTNYILLGLIVEQVTGNKLQNELARRIFEPLELKKTTFSTESFMVGNYSHGYLERNNDAKLQDLTLLDPSMAWASGAMISNLEDLAVWAKAELKERFTSDRLKNERFKWVATGQAHLSYGLGVAKFGNFIGHDGQIPGYSSVMFYLPSRDITIIVLVNKSDDINFATLLFKEIVKILTPVEAPWRLDKK